MGLRWNIFGFWVDDTMGPAGGLHIFPFAFRGIMDIFERWRCGGQGCKRADCRGLHILANACSIDLVSNVYTIYPRRSK